MFDPVQFPHCDQAVLHEPRSCEYCDRHPDWQALREGWGIAFTGKTPTGRQVPCPSDQRRGRGQAHVWGGNRPTAAKVPQEESYESRAIYGTGFLTTPLREPAVGRPAWLQRMLDRLAKG